MDPLPHPPPPDGLVERHAGPWVEDKLAILWCYLYGFAQACSGRAPRWYYVDGLAGSGVNRIGTGTDARRLPGSAILALETTPPFARCLLLERGKTQVRALLARTARYGERAVVVQGDSNRDLLPAMRERVEARAPCLCVLDPEGSELHWPTVRSVAEFRRGRTKVEQLILLPTDSGFVRELTIYGDPSPGAIDRINAVYGNDRWQEIYKRRKAGLLTPDQARTEYVQLYAAGLRDELGYRTVLDREIQRQDGHPLYFLFFATDHPAGAKIMDHCFEYRDPDEPQPTLFPIRRRRRVEP